MLSFNPMEYTALQLKQDPKLILEQIRHESNFYPDSEWRKNAIQLLEQLDLPVLNGEEYYNFQKSGDKIYLILEEDVEVDWADTPQPKTKAVLYKFENGVVGEIEQKEGYGSHIIHGEVKYFEL